jgi:hypothetical protein
MWTEAGLQGYEPTRAYEVVNLWEDRRRYAEAPRCLLGSLRAPLRASLARNGRDLPGSSRPPAS